MAGVITVSDYLFYSELDLSLFKRGFHGWDGCLYSSNDNTD